MSDHDSGWTIVLSRAAAKALRQRPSELPRLKRAIEALPAGDVRRLQGSDEYRLRVGDWRVRFRLDHQQRTIVVVRVAPRGQAYDR